MGNDDGIHQKKAIAAGVRRWAPYLVRGLDLLVLTPEEHPLWHKQRLALRPVYVRNRGEAGGRAVQEQVGGRRAVSRSDASVDGVQRAHCTHTRSFSQRMLQEFVRNEGGMKPVATLVAVGDRAVADAAVHTLWLLVRDAKASLRPGGPLGLPGVQLVDPLLDLVQQGQQVTSLDGCDP